MPTERERELARARAARWRANHPEGGRDASRRYRATHGNTPWPAKRALGLEIANLKATTPCADCGGTFPAVCMDFDHLPGFEKVNNVGTMVVRGMPRDRVMTEVAKCEIVCANCHRIRPSERGRQ